jgi:hypothetical protein
MSVKLDLKNALINGSLEYWQRNTSFAAIASGTYTADRWLYLKAGTMVHTVSRSSDVPSSAFGIYSALIDCTTAQTSLGSTDQTHFIQRIEGNMFRPLKGKKIVLSFWVKATKTGTYCVAFRNGSLTRSLVKEYSVSATNTWEKKIIRFEHDPSGSWSYDNSSGLAVIFTLASGSSFITSANTWQSGNFIATSNQVNACDNVANNFQLTDVCLQEDNEGQTREPDFQLAGRDIFEELQLCQRYYQFLENCVCYGALNVSNYFAFKVIMRIAPLCTVTPLQNTNATGVNQTSNSLTQHGVVYQADVPVGGVTYNRFNLAANAEL